MVQSAANEAQPSNDAPAASEASAATEAPPTTDSGRARARAAASNPWQTWLAYFAVSGFAAGVLWWLLAPGGAFYGAGTDFAVWFPRDATLAALLVLAGVLSAALALRGQFLPKRRRKSVADKPSRALYVALMVGGLAASVLAWRTGVFAGDLFQTPPENMPSPSMVFSLRSPTVLILWPLVSTVVVFLRQLTAYSFTSSPAAGTMPTGKLGNG